MRHDHSLIALELLSSGIARSRRRWFFPFTVLGTSDAGPAHQASNHAPFSG